MANNTLPADLDLLTREFYESVALKAESFIPDQSGSARQLRAIILDMLGYRQLPSGARIAKDIKITRPLNDASFSGFKDEWAADTTRALEALENEDNNDKDTVEASSSEQAEGTEVRETVLPEDVQ